MPLDRAHITRASRIMLPAYARFFGIVGLSYLLTPSDKLLGPPALNYANGLLTLKAWGALFLAVSVLMVFALCTKRRIVAQYALILGVVCMAIWTLVGIVAVFRGGATFGGWAYSLLVFDACRASYRSLDAGEVD